MDNIYFDKYAPLLKKQTRGVILTHGDKSKAKYSRLSALKYIDNNYNYIIFLSYIDKSVPPNNIYIIDIDESLIPVLDSSSSRFGLNLVNDPKIKELELNYNSLKDEIKSKTNIKVVTLLPSNNICPKTLSKWIYSLYSTDHILLMTSISPHCRIKFLNKLSILDLDKEKRTLPLSLYTFVKIAKKLEWKSRVTDLYTNSSLEIFLNTRNRIDLYLKHSNDSNSDNYTSIIWGDYHSDIYNKLLPIDVYSVFGLMKTMIYHDIRPDIPPYDIDFPSWSIFNHKTNGIFLSTLINNKINSCIGNFLNDNDTSIKITEIVDKLYIDAKERWQTPFTNKNIDSVIYKLDLLQDENYWIKCPSNQVEKYFKMDGESGVLLLLQDGSTSTYLPSVALESQKNPDQKWTVPEYMNNLTLKAYGINNYNDPKKYHWTHEGNWVKIYKTKSFIFKNIF